MALIFSRYVNLMNNTERDYTCLKCDVIVKNIENI